MSDFLGTGWAFAPKWDQHNVGRRGLVLNSRGGFALAAGFDDIEQAIWIILSTPVGQRVMRPTFGSQLHRLIFAPSNAETFGLAELYVTEALGFWEPRIRILDVTAYTDREERELLKIDVRYRVKSSHDERSLVYPFYRIPGE